jgi:hypothetical protein
MYIVPLTAAIEILRTAHGNKVSGHYFVQVGIEGAIQLEVLCEVKILRTEEYPQLLLCLE